MCSINPKVVAGLADNNQTKISMALKFQFQFAGVNFSRPSSPYRKWLRITLMTLAAVVSVLAYWEYLEHLTHRRRPAVAQSAVAAPKPATVTPAKSTDSDASPASPSLKKAAGESLLAMGNYLMQSAKTASDTAVATTVPAQQMSAPAPATTPYIVAAPIIQSAPTPHQYRVHTDQERLLMAGQTAFDNVMDSANKYPDAYGFQDGDFLSSAKLGDPIPVYTIQENDRANYQRGQELKPLLKPAKQWMFPVMMGDRICCMVEVRQHGREYVPGSGNKSLALAWNKIMEKWPVEDGYHPMLVVNPDVPGFYFTVPELPQQNITDTIEMFYFHPGLSPADVILASWR